MTDSRCNLRPPVAKLDCMPTEILHKIFILVDPHTLTNNLKLVCKRFYSILSDESFWKKKFYITINNRRYPASNAYNMTKKFSSGRDVTWYDVNYHFAKERRQWEVIYDPLVLSHPHYAAIDTTKLLDHGSVCVSGGRDRMLAVWDIKKRCNRPVTVNLRKHNGWIWDLAPYGTSRFFSCAWDNQVVLWSIQNGRLEEVSTYVCSKPAMTLSCVPGLVAVGLHIPRICLFDPRLQTTIHSYKAHRHTVTGVQIIGDKVLSISEDKTMSVFDLRTMCRQSNYRIRFENGEGFPRTITYHKNLVYVGDSRGYVGIYDFNDLSKPIHVYSCCGGKQLTSIWAGLGCFIVGSVDRRVRIFSPTDPIVLINDIDVPGEVTSIDYVNKVMAVGVTNNCIHVYQRD